MSLSKIKESDFIDIFKKKEETHAFDLDVDYDVNISRYIGFDPHYKRTFENCVFTKSFQLQDISIEQDIKFINCQFNGNESEFSILLNNIDFPFQRSITFERCTFKNLGQFTIRDHGNIIFSGSIINKSLRFRAGSNLNIVFNQSNDTPTIIIGDILIDSGKVTNLSLIKTELEGSITLTKRSEYENITFLGGNYNKINFHTEKFNNLKTDFADDFKKCHIKNLFISNLIFKSSIILKNTHIDVFNLENFYNNEGKFKFQNVVFSKEALFIECDLGEIQFNEVNFKEARLCFDNSYLGRCIFSNIIWPIKNIIYPLSVIQDKTLNRKNKIRNHHLLRESYRQLKYVNKAQSNFIDALKFYRNEMNVFSKLTFSIESWRFNKLKYIQDIFIIGSNKIFSDFGQSLLLPLGWLFGFHLVLFTILIVCFNYMGFTVSLYPFNHNWEAFWNGFGNYWFLLNPVHKFNIEQKGLILFIDFLMRFFSSYFIYHIIKASRKYSRL